MKKRMFLLLAGLLLMFSAAAAENEPAAVQPMTGAADVQASSAEPEKDAVPVAAEPIPIDREKLDFSDGEYWVQIEEVGRKVQNQTLTLSVYLEDQYDPEQIRQLSPGDPVLVCGNIYTVNEIEIWTSQESGDETEYLVYEIDTVERTPKGLFFAEMPDGFFIAAIGDRTAMTHAGTVKVSLPLPASFVYIDYPGGFDPEVGSEKRLLNDLRISSTVIYSFYNTKARFRDGKLLELHHWYYPLGPESDESSEN